MIDFRSYFQIAQSSAQSMAKAVHKPTLQSKKSMVAYAQAIGAIGKKASFTIDQKADMVIEYV